MKTRLSKASVEAIAPGPKDIYAWDDRTPGFGVKVTPAGGRIYVLKLHHKMRATPGAANRVQALLSKMFGLAEAWGIRPESSNPCRHIKKFEERLRERFLTMDELQRLGAALEAAECEGEHLSGIG